MSDQLKRLAAPFPVDAVSWRLGPTNGDKTAGIALAYIDARDVMDRLDDVMGGDWQDKYEAMPDGSYCCSIGLWIDGQWRWRSDGALMISESEKADAKEMAQKGSYSDAFKRAAVKWGIGRYLYNLDSPWVPIKPQGKSYAIADDSKLRAVLVRHAAAWGKTSAAQEAKAPPAQAPNPAQQVAAEAKALADAARQTAAAAATVANMQAEAVLSDPKVAAADKRRDETARLKANASAEVKTRLLGNLNNIDPAAKDAVALSKAWASALKFAKANLLEADYTEVLLAGHAKASDIRTAEAKAANPGAFRPGIDDPIPDPDVDPETGEILEAR